MAITKKPKGLQPVGDSGKYILGLDPSTKTGLVVLRACDDGRIFVLEKLVVPSKYTGLTRANFIVAGINLIACKYPITMAVIEGYGYGNAHSLATLVEIGTAIRLYLMKNNIPTVNVPPPNLKQFVTGVGNCKKDLMILHVFKNWGLEIADDNIADAYSLARMGARMLGVRHALTQKQLKAFDKLDLQKQDCYYTHKAFIDSLHTSQIL